MRIWSLHPKYLDSQGLVAVWRETLLAQKVLEGKTKGYRSHPQLIRFQSTRDPLLYIGHYLRAIVDEADTRGYTFDRTKILRPDPRKRPRLTVTRGQMKYEVQHLLNKLSQRSPKVFATWSGTKKFEPHPLFTVVNGGVEDWERQ